MTLAAVRRGSATAAPPCVDLQNVSVRFGDTLAVERADLLVGQGELTALVGEPACGKTTLLAVAAGLVAPESGDARIDGIDHRTHPEAARSRLGWLPQSAPTWPELTVREALETVAGAQGMSQRNARLRLSELAHLLGLREVTGSRTALLTHPHRVRLGLAQALMHRPRVLVLDEPLEGLAELDRVEIEDLLRGLAAEGTAVLMSARSLAEITHCAHRAIIMSGGRITAAHDLTDAPGTHRWRISTLGSATLLHRVLEGAGFDLGRPDPQAGQHASVDVDVDDEQDAAALLRTLVNAEVEVLSFAPAPADAVADPLRPWWHA